jgi:hypothetical protein
MWNDHHCPEEKRDPEQLISSGEAAWILGIDSKTVRRRFAAGKISGFRIDRGVLFRRIDVLRHREHMRDMAKYEGIMRTAYVFDQFGYLDFANYDWTPDGKMMDVKSGLAAYKMQRARIIEPMGVDPADVFMVGEILARLNISDPHVVYTLVRDGLLLPYDRFRSGANGRTNGQRMLVKKDSFAGYLGKDVPERFFNTAYLADEVGRPLDMSAGASGSSTQEGRQQGLPRSGGR